MWSSQATLLFYHHIIASVTYKVWGDSYVCCLAMICSFFYGYFSADKTDNLVGISETLISTALGGIVFALLSGQPLVVIGTTGPLLLFDESLYTVNIPCLLCYISIHL